MKKIMIIAHFCDYGAEDSNNRFNYIANILAKEGNDVELITSSFSHRDKKQRMKTKDGIYKTTLIYEPTYTKNISLKRLLYSHRKMAANLKRYLENCKNPDIVYCAIPSLSVANVAADYCEANNIKFVIDVQDLWPEAFQMVFNVPIISKLIFTPMKKKADCIYSRADEIVAVSKTYVERAVKVNKKCKIGHSIFLGTRLETFDNYAKKNLILKEKKDEFWVAYCGTLGSSYDLTCVIDAISRLTGKCNVKFVVMGDGPRRKKLERYATKKSIKCDFEGKLPYEKMCGLLSACDIVVNPIMQGAAQSIINKHADYAASGLPIINTQECEEYRTLVDQYEMGFNCKNKDVVDMAQKIEKLCQCGDLRKKMGKNARKCAEERFDREQTYQELLDLIGNI